LRFWFAGPSNIALPAVNREPWSGQSNDFSKSLNRTTPPRWLEIAETAQVRPSTVEIATGGPRTLPTTPSLSGVSGMTW
jgi:hypothetical protein